MSVDWKNKAFHLFCQGKTLREIAELTGFHRSTVERWSVTYQWRKHREACWSEARSRVLSETSLTFTENINHVSTKALEVLQEALAERQAYYRGEIPKRNMKVSGRMLVSIAKAYAALDRSLIEQLFQRDGSK